MLETEIDIATSFPMENEAAQEQIQILVEQELKLPGCEEDN